MLVKYGVYICSTLLGPITDAVMAITCVDQMLLSHV